MNIIEYFYGKIINDTFLYKSKILDDHEIYLGFTKNNKKEGIQIHDEQKIYFLQYYKKMDDGLLYMFEEDIRLRFYIKKNIEKNIDMIYFHLFSINHNLDINDKISDYKLKYYDDIHYDDCNSMNNDFKDLFDLIKKINYEKENKKL